MEATLISEPVPLTSGNPMDGGAWWAALYGVAESDMTEATLQQQPLCNFLGSKITAVVTGAMKSKDAYFLEEKL